MSSRGGKPPLPEEVARRSRRFLVASGMVGACGFAVLYFFNPVSTWFYPVCFLHQTTGLLCPGCGSLRALHQLLHGNLTAAFALNPLLVLSLPPAAAIASRHFVLLWRGQPAGLKIRPVWMWTAFAVLAVFFVVRNLPFAQMASFHAG